MKKQIKKRISSPLIALVSLFFLVSLACSVGGLTFGSNSATLEISLDQEKINLLLNNLPDTSAISGDQFLKKIDSVELHDGFLRIYGEGTTPDGVDVNGSVDVEVRAQNDVLDVEIVAVDIPGIAINDARIEQVNQVLEKELTEVVTETNGDVLLKKAEVTEGQLMLTVQVNYQNEPTP